MATCLPPSWRLQHQRTCPAGQLSRGQRALPLAAEELMPASAAGRLHVAQPTALQALHPPPQRRSCGSAIRGAALEELGWERWWAASSCNWLPLGTAAMYTAANVASTTAGRRRGDCWRGGLCLRSLPLLLPLLLPPLLLALDALEAMDEGLRRPMKSTRSIRSALGGQAGGALVKEHCTRSQTSLTPTDTHSMSHQIVMLL